MAARPLAIGCMRLSTAPDRDDERSIAVLHAALDGGVRLLDTADAYALGPDEIGHNERLIARALASWSGDRASVRVATKGGLVRPGGKWVPDGRAKHLTAACEASLRALDVPCIDLYQLHAPDPATPLRTSVRALAKLRERGLVRSIGLCNVNVGQIEAARAEVEIASVQVALGPRADEALRGGVVEHCRAHGIELFAYRPLGGARALGRLLDHPAISEVARRREVAPAEVVLAWIRSLGDAIVPLPGPTRVETARSSAAIDRVALADEDLAVLDAAFPAADIVRRPRSQRRPPDDADGEVVIVMGMPGAGKSTFARELVESGHTRLNRDAASGRLADLVPRLDAALAAGSRRFVLDNTYPARSARNLVIETAWRRGVPVRCVLVDVPIERARVQAVQRMLERHGRLLEPDEIASLSRADMGAIPPRAQLEWERELEPPCADEGFVAIERRVPASAPALPDAGRMLFVDVDRVLGEHAAISHPLRERLRLWHDEGWILAGFVWRPDGASIERERAALVEALGVPFDLRACLHGGGPPVCWCRPPLPGLVVAALHEHGAAAQRSLLVGATAQAERFAAASGLGWADARTSAIWLAT